MKILIEIPDQEIVANFTDLSSGQLSILRRLLGMFPDNKGRNIRLLDDDHYIATPPNIAFKEGDIVMHDKGTTYVVEEVRIEGYWDGDRWDSYETTIELSELECRESRADAYSHQLRKMPPVT